MKIALVSTNERPVEHGLRNISAYLQENGFETIMIFMPTSNLYNNLNYSEKNLNDLINLIKDCEIIGFSCMSINYTRTLNTIRYLRNKSKSFLIWGGIHATLFPESCIGEVDSVCIGEGEEAVLELVRKIENKHDHLDINNFWFHNNSNIIKNTIRPLLENLDILPYPDYHLNKQYILHNEAFIRADEYFKFNFWQLYSGKILIHTARGCPHSCTYCSNNALNQLYKGKGSIIRKRSVDKIMGELTYLKATFPEIKEVFIDDDVFSVRTKDELIEFSEKYKKQINIPFHCYFTPRFIDEEKLKILIDAGLNYAMIGVQTGSEAVNKNIYNRNFTNKMVLDASKLLTKYNDKLKPARYDFIVSNPYETGEDIIETIDLIKNMSTPFIVQISNLIYFPGTVMRKRVIEDKIYEESNLKNTLGIKDDIGHLKYEEKERYLNTMLRCMNGKVTDKKIGLLPRSFIDPLINLNKSKFKFFGLFFILSLVYLIGYRNRAYFKLFPLLPKSIQNYILNKIR